MPTTLTLLFTLFSTSSSPEDVSTTHRQHRSPPDHAIGCPGCISAKQRSCCVRADIEVNAAVVCGRPPPPPPSSSNATCSSTNSTRSTSYGTSSGSPGRNAEHDQTPAASDTSRGGKAPGVFIRGRQPVKSSRIPLDLKTQQHAELRKPPPRQHHEADPRARFFVVAAMR